MPYGDPFRALAYGPVVGEYGQSQMIGAYDNPLGPYDVAISPDMLKKYPLGSFVTAHDKSGKPIGNYRVADTSYYTPGKPTSNTVEFRDMDRSGQKISLSPGGAPPMATPPPAVQAPAAQWSPPEPNFLQRVLNNYGATGTQAPANPVTTFLQNYYKLLPQQRRWPY